MDKMQKLVCARGVLHVDGTTATHKRLHLVKHVVIWLWLLVCVCHVPSWHVVLVLLARYDDIMTCRMWCMWCSPRLIEAPTVIRAFQKGAV